MAVRAGRLTVPVGGRCGAGKSIPGVLPGSLAYPGLGSAQTAERRGIPAPAAE